MRNNKDQKSMKQKTQIVKKINEPQNSFLKIDKIDKSFDKFDEIDKSLAT